MSIIDRMLALIGYRRITITFIGHEREGGYTYITSPQLPGFTFMLEPGEKESLRTFIDAIEEPFMAFLSEHLKATHAADRIQMKSIQRSTPMNYVAQLSYA